MSQNLKSNKLIQFILLSLLSILNVQADYIFNLDKFIIVSNDKDSTIVKYLASILSKENKNFEIFFKHKLLQNVNIILPDSPSRYREITQSYLPDWSGAVTFGNERKIILKPSDYFDYNESRETLLHELVHIYFADMQVDTILPLWLNEGVAMYLSRKSISWNESIILGNMIIGGNVIALDEIDSLLGFGYVKAHTAYLEALLAVQYLVEKYGEGIIGYIINSVEEEHSFSDALKRNIGQDIFDFEVGWNIYLKHRYHWMFLLQFKNLMWISLVILVIVGFFYIKIRNRRIIKTWEEEPNE